MNQVTKKSRRHLLGDFLILSSLLGFLVIYGPILNLYFTSPKIGSNNFSTQDFVLTIPKIGAQSKVFENVDPYNEKEYRPVLEKGIAQAKSTSKPGQPGTIFLFAHSSDLPWRVTRFNTIFLKLNELHIGDEIKIDYQGQKYKYKVREKKEVWPSEVSFLTNTSRTQLILQTCTPLGTTLKRLLVFADPAL